MDVVVEDGLLPGGAFAGVREAIRERVDRGEVPSVSVAVAQAGEVVWQEAFGHADRERRVPATPQTVYAAGSMAKALTATALLRLAERGALDLAGPLAGFLPQEAQRETAWQPTVRQALCMTAGIPHGWLYGYDRSALAQQAWHAALERAICVAAPPGARYHYSNLSYAASGRALAVLTGMPTRAAIGRELLVPLGMQGCAVGREPWLEPRIARGYTNDGAVEQPAPEWYEVGPDAGANAWLTAPAALRFGLLHLGGRGAPALLSAETLAAAHAEPDPRAPNATAVPGVQYCCGWGVVGEGPLQSLWSNGAVLGGAGMLLLVPAAELAIACLTNVSVAESVADATAIAIADAAVPGFAAYLGGLMDEAGMAESARQLPALPPELAGIWRGGALVEGRQAPLELDLSVAGQPRLRVDGQSWAELVDATFRTDGLEGRCDARLTDGHASAHPHQLQLDVLLAEGWLAGSLTALSRDDRPLFGLPSAVRLVREA